MRRENIPDSRQPGEFFQGFALGVAVHVGCLAENVRPAGFRKNNSNIFLDFLKYSFNMNILLFDYHIPLIEYRFFIGG
jgi:hypothetical protein